MPAANDQTQMASLRRRTLTGLNPVLESVLAGVLGLLIGAIIMAAWGFNPWQAYLALFRGAYSTARGLADSVALGTPLILTALTFSICVRAGMFNIGAEGQVYMGALAAVTIAYFKLPPGLHHIVGMIFGMLAGAAWALGPALLRLTRGVHEVISTIMFNWIARFAGFYLIANILVDRIRSERTVAIPLSARFPTLVPRADLSASIFAAVAFALFVYFLLWHTVTGYEVRAAGLNPSAARYGGIKSKRTLLLSFILGGFAAGLAGSLIVQGMPPTYAVSTGFGVLLNKGFDGMVVAMVGRTHPIGILFASVFFGSLLAGARSMQLYAGVPLEMVRIVEGVIILTMAIPELVRLLRKSRDLVSRIFRRGTT